MLNFAKRTNEQAYSARINMLALAFNNYKFFVWKVLTLYWLRRVFKIAVYLRKVKCVKLLTILILLKTILSILFMGSITACSNSHFICFNFLIESGIILACMSEKSNRKWCYGKLEAWLIEWLTRQLWVVPENFNAGNSVCDYPK